MQSITTLPPETPWINRYTSIGRTLDPRTPTHALVMALAALGGLISAGIALLAGQDFNTALIAGFVTGVATFLAWVYTREIDPDYPYSALVSAGLALAASLALGAQALALLPLFAAIIGLRLINRIVGPPFHWIDSLATLALTLLLAANGEGIAAILMGIAFALDGLLKPPLRRHLAFAAVAAAAGIIGIINQPITPARLEGTTGNIIFVIVLAFGFLLISTQHVKSTTDVPGYDLRGERVQAAMVWALAAAFLSGFLQGEAALPAYLPLWAALVGTAVYRGGTIIAERLHPQPPA